MTRAFIKQFAAGFFHHYRPTLVLGTGQYSVSEDMLQLELLGFG
jgi:hypothetical protein